MASNSTKRGTTSTRGNKGTGKTGTAKASAQQKSGTARKGSGSTSGKTTAARSSVSRTSGKKTTGRNSSRQVVEEHSNPLLFYEIMLWIILAFSILILISFFGFGGFIGKAISSFCFGCFGIMAYLLPFLLFFMTAFLISNHSSHIAKLKAASTGVLYIVFCGFMELLLMGYTSGYELLEYYQAAVKYKTGGGLVGGIFVELFCPAIGAAGAYLMLIIMAIICLVLITQRSLFASVKHHSAAVYRSAKEGQARRREILENRRDYEQRNPELYSFSDLPELSDSKNEKKTSRLEKKPVFSGVAPSLDPAAEITAKELNRKNHIDTGEVDDFPLNFSVLPKEPVVSREAMTSREPRMGRYITGVTENTDLTGLQQLPNDDVHEVTPKRPANSLDVPVLDDFTIQRADTPAEKKKSYATQKIKTDATKAYGTEVEAVAEKTIYGTETGSTETAYDAEMEPLENEIAPDTEQPIEAARRSPRKPHASEEEIKEGISDVQSEMEKTAAVVKPRYVFPSLNLLKKPGRNKKGDTDTELRETAAKLQQTLHTFGVNVKVTNVSCGPSVTRYELMPEMGVKVSRIVNLADDIKLNLAAADIRIEAPIPGKAAVGIEVPNKEANGVLLRELLESEEFQDHPSNLAYAVGKDIGGKIVVADIAKMPHLLIAGATGSGKSVFINTLIMSIIYKAKPEDVKMIMIDPKVVELSVYNGIPHLFIPVVTDPKKAAGALNWAVAEMTQRYEKFASIGVRDLKGYNAKIETIKDIEDENKPEKLPQIVIIVDELADLMMVASGEVEEAICRLAQLARAAGIHLVIATQRPSVDVITGLIKANMPSRIAFSVSSGVDSRTILDMNGAEKLLGNGDMLFAPQTYKKPARVQGAFVSDKEVSDVVDFLKDKNTDAQYSAQMEEQIAQVQKSAAAAVSGGGDVDELFTDAGKFIIEKDKASIGMLQRMFKIGFNRAARIMDQLSDAGVVGAEEGTKPRKVLMSMEQFENYLEEN